MAGETAEDRRERRACIELVVQTNGQICPFQQFHVEKNPDAKSDEPFYEIDQFSDVGKYSKEIEAAAKEYSVDPDLIRAIMYMETTHGYYDVVLAAFDKNKSILPMNINVEYWKDVFGTRESLKQPENNIKAGAKMIMAVSRCLPPDASVAQIATLYNALSATKVTAYGARVEKIHAKKPWAQAK